MANGLWDPVLSLSAGAGASGRFSWVVCAESVKSLVPCCSGAARPVYVPPCYAPLVIHAAYKLLCARGGRTGNQWRLARRPISRGI